MSTVAEFRVPATDLLLGTTLDRFPDLQVTIESSVSRSLPPLWFDGCGSRELEAAFEADPSVVAAEHLASLDDRCLYEVTCAAEHRRRCEAFLQGGGSLLQAHASRGQWRVEMRFRDRVELSRTHDRLTEVGLSIEVRRVTDLTGPTPGTSRLTPEQREALTAAFERGYFEIPRRTSMEELAAELGISHQALSERLRRAYESLVDKELEPTAER